MNEFNLLDTISVCPSAITLLTQFANDEIVENGFIVRFNAVNIKGKRGIITNDGRVAQFWSSRPLQFEGLIKNKKTTTTTHAYYLIEPINNSRIYLGSSVPNGVTPPNFFSGESKYNFTCPFNDAEFFKPNNETAISYEERTIIIKHILYYKVLINTFSKGIDTSFETSKTEILTTPNPNNNPLIYRSLDKKDLEDILQNWFFSNSFKNSTPVNDGEQHKITTISKKFICSDSCGRNIVIEIERDSKSSTSIQTVNPFTNAVAHTWKRVRAFSDTLLSCEKPIFDPVHNPPLS